MLMFVPLTPIRFLQRAADLYGHKVGVVSGERQFTYAEFTERCERLAGALACLGIQPGDRVAFLSFNNHQLLEGYYGAPQARAVVMPLNVRLAPAELTAILCHSGARMLLFENDWAPCVEQLRTACPRIEKYVALDGPSPAADMTYEELLAEGRPERADIFSYDENAPAELFYTSGSTGTPKGVLLSHRTLYLHALDICAALPGYDDASVELHTIPLFHANGWGRPQCSTMLGTKQVMVRRFEPAAVLRLIERHRASDMSLVPTMAGALLNCPDLDKYDYSSLKVIHIGGAASSPALMQRMEKAFGCRVYAGYGLTETCPVVSTGRPKATIEPASEAERFHRQAMAGLALPGVEMRVVDPRMRDVPRDMTAIGEIVIRGDHVMDGYYQDPQGTAAVMTGAWLHTGDMAVWDRESYIHIVDRKKDIIITGGENVSSIEIEKTIAGLADVLECAVVSMPDETWGESPAAVVVRRPGCALDAQALLAYLEGRLAKFKIPRRIEITEEPLPKTGTGKIRKLDIRERFWAGRERRVQG
jgi:fatty-acyl-CoA synthase